MNTNEHKSKKTFAADLADERGSSQIGKSGKPSRHAKTARAGGPGKLPEFETQGIADIARDRLHRRDRLTKSFFILPHSRAKTALKRGLWRKL
jgi:hypothetical protein